MSGVLAIINGQAADLAAAGPRAELTRLLQNALPGIRIIFTDPGTDVARTAMQAVRSGCRAIIAGGGDGTINAVASAVTGTRVALGILPVGTLNHFAKDLGLPLDLAGALQVLAAGHETAVDVGEVNDHPFVNNAGLGLYPAVVALRERRQRHGMGKWPALAWATAKMLSRYPRLTIHLTVDGRQLVRTTPIIFVGNNAYTVEGLRVGTRERLDGGQLCLYIPNHRHAAGLLWFSLRSALGLRERPGELDRFLTTGFHIEAGKPQITVALDGEVTRLSTPLRFAIRPGALRVIVPAPAA